MYIPVYAAGDFIRIDEPISQPKYIRTLQPINVKVGETLTITANASTPAKLQINYNGETAATADGSSTISKTISINKAGAQQIIAQASFSNGSVHRDTIQFFLQATLLSQHCPLASARASPMNRATVLPIS